MFRRELSKKCWRSLICQVLQEHVLLVTSLQVFVTGNSQCYNPIFIHCRMAFRKYWFSVWCIRNPTSKWILHRGTPSASFNFWSLRCTCATWWICTRINWISLVCNLFYTKMVPIPSNLIWHYAKTWSPNL